MQRNCSYVVKEKYEEQVTFKNFEGDNRRTIPRDSCQSSKSQTNPKP